MEKGHPQRSQRRQSSLPSSLIPHLYTRPQQSEPSATATLPPDPDATHSTQQQLPPMRTPFTLHPLSPIDSPHGQNYDSRPPPFAARRSFYRNASPSDPHTQGITGSMGPLPPPSHILSRSQYGSPILGDPQYHTSRSERMFHHQSQARNTPSPPPQETRHLRSSWREGEPGPSSLMHTPYESIGDRERRQAERMYRHETYNHRGDVSDEVYKRGESYSSTPHPPRVENPYPLWPESFISEVPRPGSDLGSQTVQHHYPLTTVTPSQWAAGNEYHSSVSDASSDGRRDDETHETYATVQKGQKRRRDSEVEDDSRKTRNTRKTAVACNFCRGRKLRCNGAKPKCSHCLTRNFDCEYVPVQRRRGPGKAPKGTKSKKGTPTGRSETSTSRVPDRGSGLMMAEPNELTMAMDAHSLQEGQRVSLRRTRETHSPPEGEKRY